MHFAHRIRHTTYAVWHTKKEFRQMAYQSTIDNDSVALLPAARFEGRIVVVDNEADVEAACHDLQRYDMLGFDTETRPSFRAGVSYKVSLLQLSTPEVCYLFRLCNIRLSNPLLKILGSRRIIKVGVDITGDIRSLHALRHFKADGFVDLQNEASHWGIEEKSLRKLSAIVLGQRVSKAQRLSNWEAGILTDQQKEYAATDAWVSMHILERMMKEYPREGSYTIISVEEQKSTTKCRERLLEHRPRHRHKRAKESSSATNKE